MTKNEFVVLDYLRIHEGESYKKISDALGISVGSVSSNLKTLEEQGLIKNKKITEKGLQALKPYKVNNAVILAAGPSSRFVPLSLEMPKGLFKVKGEVLIERQIRQLKEAGITDITVVIGYKKESFFYLKDKFGVKFIINSEFNTKNNIESLYLAKDCIGSTYICSCDDYFTENPFSQYEYQSFYAGMETKEKSKELYAILGAKNKIIDLKKGLDAGWIVLGHSYWNAEFSKAFVSLIEKHHDIGDYDLLFWESLLKDNLNSLPDFYLKPYKNDIIFEFDYLSELRAFDDEYVNHTHSRIISNIVKYFKCDEKDVTDFRPIHEGMTNTSFIFTLKGKKYVYRHPGDGTEAIINRVNEKKSLNLAHQLGLDPTFIYEDDQEGWKISSFVDSFIEPDYQNFDDTKLVMAALRKLHAAKIQVDWKFRPWEDALNMEKLVKAKGPIAMKDFEDLKKKIQILYFKTNNDGIEKRLCHCDTYKPNWMILPNNDLILIDWEYSGYSDPGVDVGYYIVDAMYDFDMAHKVIKEYCQEEYSPKLDFHYMAYTAIIAYYWFVWALYRESCGAVMGEALYNWYEMAKKYANYLVPDSSISEKTLTRYEFEILKLLAEKGIQQFNSKELSDKLLMSVVKLKDSLKSLEDKGYVVSAGNRLILTDSGKTALEPFKAKRAIIMAAGFGSRMAPVTLERPKPLVYVNGTRIIDTLLDALIEKGITDITIIRGYKKEVFDELLEKYPFVKFIDNDDYNVTNNISSMMKARDLLSENYYICEADFVISNPDIISTYHYGSDYLGAWVLETDDWCFKSVDGYASDYKKGNTNCFNAYGISYWTKEDALRIQKDLEEIYKTDEGKQQFWEYSVFTYDKEHFKIEINPCHRTDIVEIDGFNELVAIDPSYKDYKRKD